MFLAIVDESYTQVKNDMDSTTQLNVMKFLKAGFRKLFFRRDKNEDNTKQVTKTTDTEDVQKLKNLKKAFKKYVASFESYHLKVTTFFKTK